MSVRLYGRDVGHGSLAVVTRGFRQVFESAKLLEGFVALDRAGGSEEDEVPPGAQAQDGIFTGNLNLVPMMQRGAQHERHWVTVTPNSTHIPLELLREVLRLPEVHLLSCSSWGSRVIGESLKSMGYEILGTKGWRTGEHRETWPVYGAIAGDVPMRVELHTVRHGVSGFAPVREELDKTREAFAAGEFRVVHFSTTEGERKGTLELIQAWALLQGKLPPRAKLLLVLDHHASMALNGRLLDSGVTLPPGVQVLPRGNLDPTVMARLLGHMHLVACPSRGEGFGLTPIEARASGVPVVATVTTGHGAGHCSGPAFTPILQNPELFPIDDGPGALAPRVEPGNIALSIEHAYERWLELSLAAEADAPAVTAEWSWQAQLAPLLEHLR